MSKQFLYTVRTEYPTPDGRVFVVPHGESFYMEGNPLYDALGIEARTGARLRDGGDPVWFIRLYNKFKLLPSDGVNFREYVAKLFPHDVDYEGKTEQKNVTDIDARSTLQQLHNDLFTLAEACRAKGPAKDIEALARKCISGIRNLAPGEALKLGSTLESIEPGLSVNGVCEALSMAKGGVPTPIDLKHIETASYAFQAMAMIGRPIHFADATSRVEFEVPAITPIATPPAVDALPDGPQPALTQLSQSEFCRISGMNESTLSKKLKAGGFGPLTIEHARKIKTDTDGRKRKNQTPESDEEVEKKFQQNSR